MHFHIKISDQYTWCQWSACQVGRDIEDRIGHTVYCGHSTRISANRAVKALRPHFGRGYVKIVKGECPTL